MTKKKISEDTVALRQKAEDKLKSRPLPMPEDISALSPEQIQEMVHELRVHQIELEIQNEALRAAQAELEESRSRYFDLYDMAPVGYCTLSEQGLILEANLTAATLLEMARNALFKQPISRFILNEDQDVYYLHRKRLFDSGEPQQCELRLVRPDGTFFWAHLTATAARAEDGAPVCRVLLSDITERKRSEDELLGLKRRNQALLDYSPVCHKIVDLDFNLQFMNASGFRMLKIDDHAQVYGKPYPFAFFPSSFRNEMIQNLKKVIKTGNSATMEALAKDIQGKDIWLESVLIPVLDDK